MDIISADTGLRAESIEPEKTYVKNILNSVSDDEADVKRDVDHDGGCNEGLARILTCIAIVISDSGSEE